MLKGVAFRIAATLGFTLMSAGVRLSSGRFPVGELVFFRSAVAMAVLIVWLAARGEFPDALHTKRPLGHLLRGFSGSVGMFANFAALSLLSLADATAYFYVAPIFVVFLSALVLDESIKLYRWVGVAAGFGGVILMLAEHLGVGAVLAGAPSAPASGQSLGAAIALAGAAFAALSMIQTSRLTHSEHTGAIVFYFSGLTTGVGALAVAAGLLWPADWPAAAFFARQHWVAPAGPEWAVLVVVGLAGGLAQIAVTQSYRYADASVLASFDYLAMVWAMIASAMIFGESVSIQVAVGAGIVSGAGLFVIFWTQRLARGTVSFDIPNKIG